MYKHKPNLILLGFALFVWSCRSEYPIPDPDVSHISYKLELNRVDRLFHEADVSNYGSLLKKLEEQDSAFFDLYSRQILPFGRFNDSSYNLYDTLYKYMIQDPYMQRLYDSVAVVFADMEEVEEELEDALKHYMYYFPDSTLPDFYAYVAPFVYQVVVADKLVAIELNMFMGQHFSYYSAMAANLPQYLVYRFDQRYIPVSVMRALMDGNIPGKGADANLLDLMLQEGKMMYYLDLMLPDTPDSIKIGYTEEQLEFCFENESDIWKFFAGEELFFSTRNQDKQRYIGEAPTSYGMPEGAPGRIGIWVGWQMVRQYMLEHPETSLPELMAKTDATLFLKESRYKP